MVAFSLDDQVPTARPADRSDRPRNSRSRNAQFNADLRSIQQGNPGSVVYPDQTSHGSRGSSRSRSSNPPRYPDTVRNPSPPPVSSTGVYAAPADDYAGSASFDWKGSDGTAYSTAASTVTISLTGTDDDPTITVPGSAVAATEDQAQLIEGISISDVDVEDADDVLGPCEHVIDEQHCYHPAGVYLGYSDGMVKTIAIHSPYTQRIEPPAMQPSLASGGVR